MAKKRRSKKKLFIGLAIVVLVIIVAVINLQSSNGQATRVQTDLAYLDEISEIVTASGRIQPQTKVDITAEVSAQIIEVFVNEGDQVYKGQDLVLLDTIQLQTNMAQARYSLDEVTARSEAARAQYEKDKIEFEKQKQLFARNLISETAFAEAKFTYENSKANYDAMEAQVKTGQARLDQARDNLTKTRIRAPMAGIVTYLSAEVGEIAQAQTSYTQGQRLMTIADLSVFEVEVDVDETEIAKVRLGQPARIRVDAFRDTSFAGTVVEIGNSAMVVGEGTENYSTNFSVKVRFDTTEADIRPGMSATTDITTAKADNVLLIPYASVVTREFDPDSIPDLGRGGNREATEGNSLIATAEANPGPNGDPAKSSSGNKNKDKIKKSGVFIVENGLAQFIEVTTGIADDRNIVAQTGLIPGDTVISGSFQTLRKLKDGEAVEIDEYSKDNMADVHIEVH
jgi:HlyD family secretion protein